MHAATQSLHPWRTVTRTVFQAVLSLAAGLPLIYAAASGGDPSQATGGIAIVLATSAALTRVMALPVVDGFIRVYLPFLAPDASLKV